VHLAVDRMGRDLPPFANDWIRRRMTTAHNRRALCMPTVMRTDGAPLRLTTDTTKVTCATCRDLRVTARLEAIYTRPW